MPFTSVEELVADLAFLSCSSISKVLKFVGDFGYALRLIAIFLHCADEWCARLPCTKQFMIVFFVGTAVAVAAAPPPLCTVAADLIAAGIVHRILYAANA